MNQRIKELALEAGGSHYPDVNTKQLERFAELIVRECLGVVEKCHEQAMNDKWDTDYAMCSARVDIETHFGVKE